MALAIIAFLATFLLLASLGILLFSRNAMLARLGSVVANRSDGQGPFSRLMKVRPTDSVQAILTPFENLLPRSREEVSVLQKRLIRAGYRKPSYVNMFYASKVLVPLALAAGLTVTGAYRFGGPSFTYAVALGLGFLLPDFWLRNRTAKRQLNIRLGLPQALDLMVICTEAGLGLDQCMMKVARELTRSQPEIADELSLVHLEQKAGHPRVNALKNLAERTDVDSVRALINTLVQSDTFGTSIAKTLRVYSDTLRTQRHQQAEEQAAKTTVKLVFPLVFFIFPTLFIIVLAPAGITIMETLGKVVTQLPR